MAALYADRTEREQFVGRGRELLDGAWDRLMQFETRHFTRPVALVLQQGYLETYLKAVCWNVPRIGEAGDSTLGILRTSVPRR